MAAVTSCLDPGVICFQPHSCDCWKDSAPCGLLNWGPQVFDGCSLPCALFHCEAHNMAAGFHERGWTTQKPESICHLTSELAPLHFCCTICIGNMLLGLCHSRENMTISLPPTWTRVQLSGIVSRKQSDPREGCQHLCIKIWTDWERCHSPNMAERWQKVPTPRSDHLHY